MKVTLAAIMVVGISLTQTASASFLGHVAAYTTAGVAAHEVERYIDHRKENQNSNRNADSAVPVGDGGNAVPLSQAMPNPQISPGRINGEITQDNIDDTICRRGGYTRSVRPPEDYTYKLKREQIRQYGYSDRSLHDYEEDHVVPLELGGSPSSPQNLWPQPHNVEGGWGSFAKDKLENTLHELVCSHKISLARAQHDIATNWIEAYKRYIGPNPDNTPPRSYRD